jgi:hypothetical protein
VRIHRSAGCVALLLSAVWASNASAGFVNGVETFDGTKLDLKTWELFVSPFSTTPATANQNNALLLDASSLGQQVDYTTRSVTVPVGGSVRADVTYLGGVNNGGRVSLFLTTNSNNAQNTTTSDSRWLQLVREPDGVLTALSGGFGSGGGNALVLPGTNFTPLVQPQDATYTYEIKRITDTMADFNAYGPDDILLGSQQLTFDSAPDPLFVSLAARGAAGRFDNVTVNPAPPNPPPPAVPLPAGVWTGAVVLAGVFGYALRSRRIRPV